jgi:hypothetical protein
MKRVLFLAVLIVSIVEFTMERDRMHLVLTTVVLLALIYSLFHRKHQSRAATKSGGNADQKESGRIAA